MAALMIFGIAIPTTAIDAEAATVNINFSGRIQIPNTTGDRGVGRFLIDGKTRAFCMDHDKESPSGPATSSIQTDPYVAKAVYYGWQGPGQWSGFNGSADAGIVFTSILISQHETGEPSYIGDWLTMDGANFGEFKEYVERQSTAQSGTTYTRYSTGDNDYQMLASVTPEIDVSIRVNKTSSNTDITNGNDCYSLAGAQYQVSAGGSVLGTITTNAQGVASATYTLDPSVARSIKIKETKASTGYALDTQTYTADGSSGSVTINSKEPPQNDPTTALIYKIDAETHDAWNAQNLPQGSASLENAEYTVKYYDGYYDTEAELADIEPTRTWVFKTDKNGYVNFRNENYFISGDEFYRTSAGYATFPLGTVTIQETKAPEGYILDDNLHIRQITPDGSGIESVSTYNPPTHAEQIKRGDLEFVKVDTENQQRLSGIPFLLTNEDTGESHVIVTDENGYFSSANDHNAHSNNTNANDAAYADGEIDESKLDLTAGVWFGETDAIASDRGALIYGNYTLEELRCSANEGYTLVKNIKISISRDSYTVNIGTISDHIVEIDTVLSDTDLDRDNTTLARPGVELTDRVEYKRLESGEDYRIEGVLVDKDTAEPVTVNGKQITAIKEFSAEKASGSEELVYEFDATGFEGKTVVSFVKIYRGDTLVGSHEEINDPDQAMRFLDTRVDTTAIDNETESHWALADDEVTITDSITYDNLLGQYIYEVTGTLMDKESGEPLKDKDGNDISVTEEIEPNRGEGELEMEFTLDASALEGKDLVVFQEFTLDGVRVAGHENMNDADQTIHFPKVRTAAADSETEHRISYADNEVTIIDTVKYENVASGVEHTVKGTLVDKETGKEIAEAEKTFTPDSKNGTVDVEFTFDGTDYAGKDIVVYEELYMENHLVGQHKDIDDLDQTVNLPKVETEAMDKETGTKFSFADDEAIVVDTLKYTNVLVGEEYTAKASLIDRENEDVIATAEKVFTAEHSNGTVDVEITFDPSKYEGKDVVVFEQLLFEGHIVGTHEDPQDPDQTVNIPEIGTKAIDSETGFGMSLADDEVTIIDIVTYKNLIPDQKYTVKGRLMDKETGSVLTDKNGNEITAEATFTAEKEDGEVELEFTFRGVDVAGKTAVAFEKLYFDGELIAEHEDIDDPDQTVILPKVSTAARDSETDKQIANADNDITIIDTFKYENLVKGDEYTLKGSIVDKENAKVIAEAEKTFTAEDNDGTVDMQFTFDGRAYAGKDIVVFENLYFDDELIGQHADINDEAQTVNLPAVATNAKDKESGSNTVIHKDGKTITVVDTVTYTNVIPGQEYTVKGRLMDKETGKTLTGKDGKEITAEKVFTAVKESGTVDLEFTLDISELSGKHVVAFEQLWLDDDIVGTHEDINDEEQTIYIQPKAVKTGDEIPPVIFAAAAAMIIAAGTTIIIYRKRKTVK